MSDNDQLLGKHVAFLSWRDTRNPEGGGAERYLEAMASGLVERGASVTIFCAAHPAAPPEEVVDGIRFVRRGSKLSVYLEGMRALRRGDLGHPDVIVDVQNGLPFFTRLVTRAPVVVLVHHVHREQWPVVYPGLTGRVGWFIEHRLTPLLYRRSQYISVSRATRAELQSLGVRGPRIAVVHNGTDPVLPVELGKSATPLVAVVGRLVPHKQVEHAIDAVLALRATHPELRLHVVGSGWWEARLHDYARTRQAGDAVVFEGHVDEARKNEIYEAAWLLALPSLKEGWGLVVGEAGMHGTPTVAYRDAGGTQESVVEGFSGVLVDDRAGFTAAIGALLDDDDDRERLGRGAAGPGSPVMRSRGVMRRSRSRRCSPRSCRAGAWTRRTRPRSTGPGKRTRSSPERPVADVSVTVPRQPSVVRSVVEDGCVDIRRRVRRRGGL